MNQNNSSQTLVFIKPDGVEKKLINPIKQRFIEAGFIIEKEKEMILTKELVEKHYQEHIDKYFFQGLVNFSTSGPVYMMILRREDAVEKARELIGSTNPQKAKPGTIRYDYAKETENITKNIIHGSDSIESAQREIEIFFN